MQTRRFKLKPYETPHAHSNKHADAEVGPSNPVPLLVLHLAPPPTTLGGSSEATADANDRTITEEEAVPVSHFYCLHDIPHVRQV